MSYKYLFFDLDGTLTDSGYGIMKSVKYALNKMEWEIPEESVLRKFIGPPLSYSFREFCGMNEEQVVDAIEKYREYFSQTGLFENEVYDGIEELLQTLQEQEYKLVLATSKPEVFSLRIMEHFNLDKYFLFIAGSSLDETRNTKEAVIRYALDTLQIHNTDEVLMIGDREHDVFGAKACQIACLGVLWGYGSEKELLDAGAVELVSTPGELIEVLHQHTF